MRLPFASLVLSMAAVGCGGTTFYDIQGQAPKDDLSGKVLIIKTFSPGAVSGLTSAEAAESATSAFTSALYNKKGITLLSREDLRTILKERNMAEMNVDEIDDKKLASIMHADAVVSGRVITARQDGRTDYPTNVEVEISVRATNLKGEMIWLASQRAVSTVSGIGIGHLRMFKKPAKPAGDLMRTICANLAALITVDEVGDGGTSSP